jgi:hypothetical protein
VDGDGEVGSLAVNALVRGRVMVLGTDTFRDVQSAYLQLQAIMATPPADRGDAVFFWPALVTIDRASEAVGKAARVNASRRPAPSSSRCGGGPRRGGGAAR